jgi:dTDP-4-dehydrorhamnose 3,5-epimerase
MIGDVVKVTNAGIPDVYLIELSQLGDERGFFSEIYNKKSFAAASIDSDWVQDNHVFSNNAGTLRGLHFQRPPYAQAKLVRVSRGTIYDVVVDIRKGSPSFGRWVSAIVSASLWNAILVPKGFAHGYLTLEEFSEVQYKVDAFYASECEAGIVWNDPDLAIDWPLNGTRPLLSARDRDLPRFNDIDSPFVHGE